MQSFVTGIQTWVRGHLSIFVYFIQVSHSLHLVHIQQWYIKGICSREFLHVEWVLRLVEGCLDTHFQWVASSLESYILGPGLSGTLLNNPLILPLTKDFNFSDSSSYCLFIVFSECFYFRWRPQSGGCYYLVQTDKMVHIARGQRSAWIHKNITH